MNRTAYLVVYVDIRTLQVVGAAVCSEPAISLTMTGRHERPLDVYSYSGKDFEDAQRQIVEYVRSESYFSWIVPLLPR